jgi:hypothetical protein
MITITLWEQSQRVWFLFEGMIAIDLRMAIGFSLYLEQSGNPIMQSFQIKERIMDEKFQLYMPNGDGDAHKRLP